MRLCVRRILVGLLVVMPGIGWTRTPASVPVKALKFTVLSTNLVGTIPSGGIGEWGFSGLLEVDGRRWLIDTGRQTDAVLRNAEERGIDLSTVTDLVLTHNHSDHTGGLITLRRELSKKNPQALSRTHLARGIFLSRLTSEKREDNGLLPIKEAYEQLGGTFIEHSGPVQLAPGVWLLGPVPRIHPERNCCPGLWLQTPAGPVEDTVPEDTAIVVDQRMRTRGDHQHVGLREEGSQASAY